MTTAALKKTITRLSAIREEIAVREGEYKTLAAQIVLLGKGDYQGLNGESVKVIEVAEGKPAYKLSSAADEEKARAILGEDFSSVFDKKVSYEPCKSFADVVVKLFPRAIVNKLLALVEKPGKAASAYLKWS